MSAALAEGSRLYSGGIHVRGNRGESQCYGRGAAPRVRAAKSYEFGQEKL